MKTMSIEDIKKGIIDVSTSDISYENGAFKPSETMINTIVELAEKSHKFTAVCGAGKLLAKHGLAIENNTDKVYDLYENIFKSVMSHINMEQYSVTDKASSLGVFDVDGYKVNGGFSHDGKVEERRFVTTKCIHFDTATPFIANIYGPNKNITGGYPIITETHKYLKDKNLQAKDIVINIPQNYNIAVRQEHYEELMKDYSFCLQKELDDDMLMIIMLNEIEFGVAHAATDPVKKDESLDCSRPIRHYEYQYEQEEHYDEWLDYYNLELSEVSDYDGTVDLSLNRYKLQTTVVENVVEI